MADFGSGGGSGGAQYEYGNMRAVPQNAVTSDMQIIMSYSQLVALRDKAKTRRSAWHSARGNFAAQVNKLKQLTVLNGIAPNSSVHLDGTSSGTLANSTAAVLSDLAANALDVVDDNFDDLIPLDDAMLGVFTSEKFWRMMGATGDLLTMVLVSSATGTSLFGSVDVNP